MNSEPRVPVTSGGRSGPRVLVTGGTGFVGKVAVRRLIADGYRVRVLARQPARADAIADLGAEVFSGDVADLVSFGAAFQDCDMVVHLAAGTSGSERDSQTGTIEGTRNLLELCRRYTPKRLVYISSCSVYGVADYEADALVDEDAPLERFPDRRGFYSAAKQQAERLVVEYRQDGDVPVVVLRPGTVYGPGGDLYPGMMGVSFGSTYIVIGDGSFVLPLVHVENLAGAIALCLSARDSEGQIFNVVDPERITKRAYVDRVIRRVDANARVIYVPYLVFCGITGVQELACRLTARRPILTRYRLRSSQNNVVYDVRRIERLGWKPTLSLQEGLEGLVAAAPSMRSGAGASDPRTPASGVRPRVDAGQLPAGPRSAR